MPDFRVHVLQSLGATTELLDFLAPYDVLRLQYLSKWMYGVGVGRVQLKYRGPRLFFFAFPLGSRFSSTLFVLNEHGNEGIKRLTDAKLDLEEHRIM